MIDYKYLMYRIILVILGYLYDKYNIHNKMLNENKQYDIVKKHLLKESSSAKSKFPILWIHIDKELNELLINLDRQFLHAKTLGFIHPKKNKEMIFNSILPKELEIILKKLRNTKKINH